MKRGWIVAIVVVVLLYPASAWLMGYAIEHRVDAFAQQFNDTNPYVRVSGNQFHRGWYVSNQELTLEPAQAALGAGSMRVTAHNVIHHGPICGLSCIGLARIDTHLEFSPQLQQYMTSIFGTAEPLSITSRLDDEFLKSVPGGAASLGRLQPFIAQAMATHEGGKFHTTIGLHAGQVSFNGKAFGPPTAEHK